MCLNPYEPVINGCWKRQQMGHNRFTDESIDVCSTSEKNKQHLKWLTECCSVLFLFSLLIPPSLCVYLSELSDRTVFSCQSTAKRGEANKDRGRKWDGNVCIGLHSSLSYFRCTKRGFYIKAAVKGETLRLWILSTNFHCLQPSINIIWLDRISCNKIDGHHCLRVDCLLKHLHCLSFRSHLLWVQSD